LRSRKNFFSEEKEGWPPAQKKTFLNLGRWRRKLPAQKEQTFFAPLFFKKAAAFFY
jgi:hypothetical protein